MKKKFSRSIVHKATAQRERHPMQGIHFFSLKKEMNRFRGVGTSVHTHESQTKEKHEEYLTTTPRAWRHRVPSFFHSCDSWPSDVCCCVHNHHKETREKYRTVSINMTSNHHGDSFFFFTSSWNKKEKRRRRTQLRFVTYWPYFLPRPGVVVVKKEFFKEEHFHEKRVKFFFGFDKSIVSFFFSKIKNSFGKFFCLQRRRRKETRAYTVRERERERGSLVT